MEEKVQQMIEYLVSHGFDIPDLNKAYNMAGLKFSVDYHKSFGEDSMDYKLNFSWDHQFQNYRWDGYKATYYSKNGQERSQGFIASYVGIAHANLAYHVLSGRLEDIREQLMESGLEQYTSTDINEFLERKLSQNQETFTFYSFKNDKEGLIDFEIAVALESHYYKPGDIKATFMRYPDIEHGIYNGIDTAELAAQMDTIDWERDDLYKMDENDIPQPSPEIEGILDQVYQLLRDEKGKDAAIKLQIIYWLEAPFFEAHVHKDALQLYEQLPKQNFSFPLETGGQKIYNLMCGRPAVVKRLTDIEGDSNQWQKLIPTNQGLTLVSIEGPSRRELETYLSMLPLDAMYRDMLLAGLFRGDICRTTLYGLQHTEVLVSVDLEQKSLRISTLEGKNIPYNFKLEQAQEPIIIPAQTRVLHNPVPMKKKKKRRGKGL